MADKTKTILAIFAVTIMLGCALMPFTAMSTDGDVTVTENDKGAEGITLADIVKKLKNIGNAESFELGNALFTKVSENDFEPIEIDPTIQGTVSIEKGYSLSLGTNSKGTEYIITPDADGNDGCIEVKKGAELIIFSPDVNDVGFKFTNQNDPKFLFNVAIWLHSGSFLSIFGIPLMITYADSGEKVSGVHLLRIEYIPGAKVGEGRPEATFAYSYKADKSFTLDITASKITRMALHKAVIDGYSGLLHTTDISVKGIIDLEFNGDAIIVNIMSTGINLDIHQGDDTITGSFFVDEMEVILKFSTDGSSITNEGSVGMKVSNINISYYNGTEDVLINFSKKSTSLIGGFDFFITSQVKGTDAKLAVSVKSTSAILFYLDAITITFYPKSSTELEITAENLSLRIEKINFDVKLKKSSTAETAMGEGNADIDLTISASSMKIQGVLKLTLIKLKIDLLEIDDFGLSTSMKADITNEKNWTAKTDLLKIRGDLTKILATYYFGDDPIFGNYVIGMELDVTDLSAVMKNGKLTHSCDADVKLTTMNSGILRTAVASAENIIAREYGEESYEVTIQRIYVKNDLPLKSMLQNVITLMDNVELELEANDVTIEYKSITADSVSIHYWNLDILDDLYVQMNSASFYYDEDAGDYKTSCITGTGYSQYKGEKKNFSMDRAVMKVGFTTEFSSMMAIAHFYSGTLNFSEGVVLPMMFTIEKDVSLNADGLQVGIFISNSTNVNGTVVIDTESGIGVPKDSNWFVWLNSYRFEIKHETNVGCRITFGLTPNLSGIYGGYIEASKNYVLPDDTPESKENIEYYMGDGVIYFWTSLTEPGVSYINCICPGNGPYRLSIDGSFVGEYNFREQVEDLYSYGIGYTDGSGKVFVADESTGLVPYVMPARDVNLTTVYAVEAKPTTSGNTLILDASKGGNTSDIAVVDPNVEIKEGTEAVKIIISGATIRMSVETFEDLVAEALLADTNIYIKAELVTASDNESIQNAIAGNTTYNITMKDKNGNDFEYDGSTDFEVTVKVKCNGDLSSFKVSYVDEYGKTDSVKLKEYRETGTGAYEVTFYANHFSLYTIESSVVDNGGVVGAIFIAVVLIVLAIFGLLVGGRYHDKRAKAMEDTSVADGIAMLAINQGVVEPPTTTEKLFFGYVSEEPVKDPNASDSEKKN